MAMRTPGVLHPKGGLEALTLPYPTGQWLWVRVSVCVMPKHRDVLSKIRRGMGSVGDSSRTLPEVSLKVDHALLRGTHFLHIFPKRPRLLASLTAQQLLRPRPTLLLLPPQPAGAQGCFSRLSLNSAPR